MLSEQTMKPDHIELVNDKPLSDYCDITYRYRIGFERLKNKGFDCVLLIENDDWYSPKYIETMVKKWEEEGRPSLLGHRYTYYYHIRHHIYEMMHHKRRSSAMNTLVKGDIEMTWPADHDPYADIHIWREIGGVTFTPEDPLCIGMKHGVGKLGGRMHKDKFERYRNKDGRAFLLKHLDEKSLYFYLRYYEL